MTEPATEPEQPEVEPGQDAQLVTKSYTLATSRLREEYKARFNQLRTEAAAELGFEWHPKPSAEDQAREQLQEILARFPHLKDEWLEGAVPEPPE